MDVDGLQTSQGSQNDAVGERVCAGVFDVTPDSCVSHTQSRGGGLFWQEIHLRAEAWVRGYLH